jgi:hypothetical protein
MIYLRAPPHFTAVKPILLRIGAGMAFRMLVLP